MGVDQPRASGLIAGAVEAGLVRREADQSDGRRALLVRTEAGRALTQEVHRFRRSVFAEAMEGWPEADRADLRTAPDALCGGTREPYVALTSRALSRVSRPTHRSSEWRDPDRGR
ncbi:MarR family winged helix-turn-helix transcriptional regulator [Streptomyces sp. NPDC005393]|uniref:MarR family winged helix-turn-helix transcriptional regulator n=1 Tax=Streptomyces sp. NPDC005393 TaxID=3157041 RepID=UPI0033BF2759